MTVAGAHVQSKLVLENRSPRFTPGVLTTACTAAVPAGKTASVLELPDVSIESGCIGTFWLQPYGPGSVGELVMSAIRFPPGPSARKPKRPCKPVVALQCTVKCMVTCVVSAGIVAAWLIAVSPLTGVWMAVPISPVLPQGVLSAGSLQVHSSYHASLLT